MSGERPSDRAIAAAFWAFVGDSHNGTTSVIEQRASELDATAAPVVVGEDGFLREALHRLSQAVDAPIGSTVTITKADACAIGQFLTAALAGD